MIPIGLVFSGKVLTEAVGQMLRWLLQKMGEVFFQIAQNNPELLEMYQSPRSMNSDGNNA